MRSTATDAPNLRRAVKAAYRMRDTYDCGRLWFDPFIIPSTEKLLRVCRYTTFCERHGLEYGEFMQTVPSPDGFTLRDEKRYIIIYNDAP